MRIAPLSPRHLPPAADRKQAPPGIDRQLCKEAGDIGSRADEAGGRRHGVGRMGAGYDEAAADGEPKRMAARERSTLAERHVGPRLAQACAIDDLALDPDAIRLSSDRFDHKT